MKELVLSRVLMEIGVETWLTAEQVFQSARTACVYPVPGGDHRIAWPKLLNEPLQPSYRPTQPINVVRVELG